jgi:hypothetical protein
MTDCAQMMRRNRKITGSVSLFWSAIFVMMAGGVRAESSPQVTSDPKHWKALHNQEFYDNE